MRSFRPSAAPASLRTSIWTVISSRLTPFLSTLSAMHTHSPVVRSSSCTALRQAIGLRFTPRILTMSSERPRKWSMRRKLLPHPQAPVWRMRPRSRRLKRTIGGSAR